MNQITSFLRNKKKLILLSAINCIVTFAVTYVVIAVYLHDQRIDMVTTIFVPAIVSAVSTAIPIYIGVVIGIPKETEGAMNMIIKRFEKSPTAKRVIRVLEMSDKLFGDDQAVAQIIGFFKDARELMSSPEAKNFFKNATEALTSFTSENTGDKVSIELPRKPTENRKNASS